VLIVHRTIVIHHSEINQCDAFVWHVVEDDQDDGMSSHMLDMLEVCSMLMLTGRMMNLVHHHHHHHHHCRHRHRRHRHRRRVHRHHPVPI
jgi:hypothetical protein